MFYLFNNVFLDFDYKQNIKDSNAIILSKEFGSYNYSKEIDSMNFNIPLNQLNDRLLVSSDQHKDISNYQVNYRGESIDFISFLKSYFVEYKNSDLIIYANAENYCFIICWFFKTFFPNMTKELAYKFYSHKMTCMNSLNYLRDPSFIFNQQLFDLIYNDTRSSESSIDNTWKLKINISFKFLNLCSKYNLEQLEDLKSILLQHIKNFYTRTFQKTYRKLVENYNYFEEQGILYKENNNVIWRISDDLDIQNVEQINYELIDHILIKDSSLNSFALSALETEISGERDSFKRILNLRKEVYDHILDPKYKDILKVDPLHFFFSSHSIEKFNPIQFIKFSASLGFNSGLFRSSTFKGNIPIILSFISKLIKEDSSELHQFCLNKI